MVTPVENQDANVYVPFAVPEGIFPLEEGIYTRRPFQAAADGDAVTYVAEPTGGGARSGLSFGDSYMATRSADGGWSQVGLQPYGYKAAAYQAFSADLSVGILAAGVAVEPELRPLAGTGAPGGGYNVLYARDASDGSYHALFTVKPPHRSPAEFRSFDVPNVANEATQVSFAGGSADFSRLFFEANDALTAGAAEGNLAENNLYESAGGVLQLVNVLPDGGTEANATFGAPALEEPSKNPPDFDRVVSVDGSRVFWTDLNTNVLYLRENGEKPESPLGPNDECLVPADACTVPVSAGPGRYWSASTDGRYAFYTEGQGEESELYRFDAEGGTRVALTAPKAGVEGVLGASEDGEYVYFAATGVLAGNENEAHQSAVAGGENLYMVKDQEKPVFIGTLSSKDGTEVAPFIRTSSFTGFGDWQPGVGHRTAEVAGDGSLVFMSDEGLTGYGNEVEGERLEEVFVYEPSVGRLVCVSCAAGVAPSSNELTVAGAPVAAFLPINWSNSSLPRWISGNGGRVFFDSDEPLVAEDTNGRQDVYEWERDGEGSCGEASGCVFLLSGGVSSTAAWLEGVSESGNDVFIATRAQLVTADQNEAFDLYDARVGGVQPVLPPECSGTACQGLPAPPPTFATPSSVTFEGVGNFAPPAEEAKPAMKPKAKAKPAKCKKGFVKKKGRCVKQAKGRRGKGRNRRV